MLEPLHPQNMLLWSTVSFPNFCYFCGWWCEYIRLPQTNHDQSRPFAHKIWEFATWPSFDHHPRHCWLQVHAWCACLFWNCHGQEIRRRWLMVDLAPPWSIIIPFIAACAFRNNIGYNSRGRPGLHPPLLAPPAMSPKSRHSDFGATYHSPKMAPVTLVPGLVGVENGLQSNCILASGYHMASELFAAPWLPILDLEYQCP